MFSILFPGQGSQNIGMARELFQEFSYVKEYFLKADDLLKKNLSEIILNGPKSELDKTENTQPAIFLASYSFFKIIEKETQFEIMKAKYFAGHSLGEYSALCCAGSINFDQTIRLLKQRGEAMQNALPNRDGGMTAVLGSELEEIKNILNENKNKFSCFVANDNSNGQIVMSGKIDQLELFGNELKKKNIKFINLPVTAPFHCPLMRSATETMKDIIIDTEFKDPSISIVSNVTAKPLNKSEEIKKLLIEQIEKPVRWRESIENMIDQGIKNFVEVGPGKILSGLVKRIDRNVKLNQVNNLIDAKSLKND